MAACQGGTRLLSGDKLENDYVETAVAADMPLPVTTARRGRR